MCQTTSARCMLAVNAPAGGPTWRWRPTVRRRSRRRRMTRELCAERRDRRRPEGAAVERWRRLERRDLEILRRRTGWRSICRCEDNRGSGRVRLLQDNFTAPVDPTPALTFSRFGLTNFTVQYSGWNAVDGGAGRRREWEHPGMASGDVPPLIATRIRGSITGTSNA